MNAHKAYKIAYANPSTRDPELERCIITNAHCAYKYAFNIIKRRWIEAEPYIFKNHHHANEYLRVFPEARTSHKDIPLVLGYYALIDVPNTITDEQVVRLLTLLGLSITINNDNIRRHRTYFEPYITQKINTHKLYQVTTTQILHSEILKREFSKQFGYYQTDFI